MPSRLVMSLLLSRLGPRAIALAAFIDPSRRIFVHTGLAGDLTPGVVLLAGANARKGCLVLVCVAGRNPIVAVVVPVVEAFLGGPLRALSG
jgi:hypothetical protein